MNDLLLVDKVLTGHDQAVFICQQRNKDMSKTLVILALLGASLQAQITGAPIAANAEPSAVRPLPRSIQSSSGIELSS